MNGFMEYKIYPNWKGKSSELNLHDFGFKKCKNVWRYIYVYIYIYTHTATGLLLLPCTTGDFPQQRQALEIKGEIFFHIDSMIEGEVENKNIKCAVDVYPLLT